MLHLITFAITASALPGAAQEHSAAYLRCQKSGCPTPNTSAEESALIVSGSRPVKVFPILLSLVIIFVVIRVAAHFLRRLFLILCNNIGKAMGRCYHSFFRRQRRRGKNERGLVSRTLTRSFDSLTDLIDDDSTAASYSSATSGYASSEGDSQLSIIVDDDNSSVMESQLEAGFMSSSPLHSSAGRPYKQESTGDQSVARGRGEKEAIVSKFLTYIRESDPKDETGRKKYSPQRTTMHDRRSRKRRPTVTFAADLSFDENNDHEGKRRQRRRHTMDAIFRASYPPNFAAYQRKKRRRSERSNHTQSLVVTSHGSLQLDEVTPDEAKIEGQDPIFMSKLQNVGSR